MDFLEENLGRRNYTALCMLMDICKKEEINSTSLVPRPIPRFIGQIDKFDHFKKLLEFIPNELNSTDVFSFIKGNQYGNETQAKSIIKLLEKASGTLSNFTEIIPSIEILIKAQKQIMKSKYKVEDIANKLGLENKEKYSLDVRQKWAESINLGLYLYHSSIIEFQELNKELDKSLDILISQTINKIINRLD